MSEITTTFSNESLRFEVKSVRTNGDELTLSGNASFTSGEIVRDFIGNINKSDGSYIGNFNYSEDDNGSVNSSVYGVPLYYEQEAYDLIRTTVFEIKKKYGNSDKIALLGK